MGAPYVSSRRLVDNSLAAMLSAVEVYNKPQMTYRDEVYGGRRCLAPAIPACHRASECCRRADRHDVERERHQHV